MPFPLLVQPHCWRLGPASQPLMPTLLGSRVPATVSPSEPVCLEPRPPRVEWGTQQARPGLASVVL